MFNTVYTCVSLICCIFLFPESFSVVKVFLFCYFQKRKFFVGRKEFLFIYDFSNKLRKQFHDEIWKTRCEAVIDMEKTLGIAKKDKRTAQNKDNKQDFLKTQDSKKRRKKSSLDKDRILEQDAAVHSSIIDKIDLWVQWGKKWMGI